MSRRTLLTLAVIVDLLCWFSLGFLISYCTGVL